MSELQNRRYKEVTPEETVKRLKKILEKMQIEVEEVWKEQSSVGTYSLRLCIKDTDLGQNGKGMTKEYAMASAYAEFFERLQNGVLRFRIEKPTQELPFANSPDEKHLSIEELVENNNSLLESIANINECKEHTKEAKKQYVKEVINKKCQLLNEKSSLSLPYYSVRNKEIQYIPDKLFNYLFGSNGMCAGNSKEEALIEGLSEILERYVAIKILKERLVLPEIPDSYIANFPKVQKMSEKLKGNSNFYFRLVDCSLGGKYPVAGLYILEKNTGRFGFKLGAHPDYGIAMERCFTEAAQGRDIYEYAQVCLFDFYEQDENEDKNLSKFILSDFSSVPYQMIGPETTYKFTQMPDVSKLDNKTILRNLVNDILKEKKDILIRDLSILGFPTYSIAIPEMSEFGFDPKCNYLNVINTVSRALEDIEKINLDNIEEIIKGMEIIINELGCESLSMFISLKDTNILPCEQFGMGAKYFLAICYIMNKEYEKSAKILEDLNYIEDSIAKSELEKVMVKAVYYYVSAMDKLKEHKKAMYYIYMLFDNEIAQAIDLSFNERDKILLNHYGITKEDYVDNDDSYYLPFMKTFREAQRDNIIDQMENRKIFE